MPEREEEAICLTREAHPTWWLLFIVLSKARASWLQSVVGGVDELVQGRAWVGDLATLGLHHLDAPISALRDRRVETVRALAGTADARARTPVGSQT